MVKNKIYRISQWLMMACLVMTMVSCRETIESIFSDDIAEGDEVMFTASLPSVAVTRSDKDDYQKAMDAYQAVCEAYEFTIGMYQEGKTDTIGTAVYQLSTDGNLVLKDGQTSLSWPSTTVAYGFKATAGTNTIEADQSTKENLLAQDHLEGYGYIQKWDDTNSAPIDKLDELNYHTAKQWKALNREVKLVSNEDDYKRIPLYLQHKRSLITIVLKAGEGVSREALAYAVAKNDLSARIYSHKTESLEITPLASEEKINYDADKNGDAASDVSTTRYDAIVEPYNYAENPSTDLIAKVSLSGQNYSFYAENDKGNLSSYDLAAGKHLTITITLGRESRKTLMTAYIEDWTEEVTTTICDDHGYAGEPIKIETLEQLKEFLGGANNKAGSVALVEKDIDLSSWSTEYSLNCTLNLGGNKLTTDKRFLKGIGSAASLQNGTIEVTADVDAAIAETNSGTIEDVKITTIGDICASKAGAVIANAGTISKCHSAIRVSGGTAEYVGGIAATSISLENKAAIIDGCTVTNRVDGGTVKCGGIVGQSKGDVTNNTFEYGITLSQVKDTHKNIVGEIVSGSYAGNAWPTVDENLGVTNTGNILYTGIIDCEDDFGKTSAGNYNYRLAKDIEVGKTVGDVAYELDGNGMQITTSKMIFETITGKVHDLTVVVSADMIATQNDDKDYMAPLAYAVSGLTAEIRNVKVLAEGKTIQAANPAGLVVWAKGGATISNCEVTANIKAYLKNTTGNQYKFAGGIVSTAAKAVVTQCVFHSASNLTTEMVGATAMYYGGIVGGVDKAGEDPELTITDCANFCGSYITDPEDAYHGGILGYAKAVDSSNTTKDCQGNWWPDNKEGKISKGVAVCEENKSVEATIGKRNAVKPTEK